MGMKIQAITRDDGLNVEVGKTYYIEDTGSDITGEYKVTHIEVIAAPTASGVEVRVEIEWQNPVTGFYKYAELPLDAITEEVS